VRFALLLLGANEASGFVRFIYGLSRPFVLPFQGIFGEPTLGASVIEWASLVGIIVYALVAYGLARLIELIYTPATRTR
jgi:YGGT family